MLKRYALRVYFQQGVDFDRHVIAGINAVVAVSGRLFIGKRLNGNRSIESCDIDIFCSFKVAIGKLVNVTKKMKKRPGKFFTQSGKTLVGDDDAPTRVNPRSPYGLTNTFPVQPEDFAVH